MRGLLATLGTDFQLVVGKMVYELKPGGRNKGTAIADFIKEPPFCNRLPVFIGDDMTDEDGFEVVNSVGGHSIKVGQGASLAHWHLSDAHSVRCWLEAYSAFLDKGEP
jgi:trehalose 6-phosphate phosphatase